MPLVNGLPDFWHHPVPGQRAVQLTRFIDGFELTDVPLTFISPIEAYDYAEKNLSVEVQFDVDVFEGWGEPMLDGSAVSVPIAKQPGMRRVIISANTLQADREEALEAYALFLQLREAYLAEPEHFYTAYEYVRHHPYFWNTWGQRGRLDEILGWEYELQSDDLHLNVFKDDAAHGSRVVFMLESGPYTGQEGARHEHTLDTRLTSSGESYETALLKFAATLEATVDETGTVRTGQL
jgi:hypothetical protein